MPSVSSSTEVPNKENLIVRTASEYATLWSQYLTTNKSGHQVFYIFLAPFFFTQLLLKFFTSSQMILLIEPKVYPIQIPSTAENPPETPIAYTADNEYHSKFDAWYFRPLRIFTIGYYASKAYLCQSRIAYIVCDETEVIDADAYLITEDEESLRPIVLFR